MSPSITASCMTTPIRRAPVRSHSRNSAPCRSSSTYRVMLRILGLSTDKPASLATPGVGNWVEGWGLGVDDGGVGTTLGHLLIGPVAVLARVQQQVGPGWGLTLGPS